MTDPHEDLVEAVVRRRLSARGFGFYLDPMEGGQDAYDITMEEMNEVHLDLALIAERTKDATDDMCEAWSKAAISSRAEGDWIAMHLASALWPKEKP